MIRGGSRSQIRSLRGRALRRWVRHVFDKNTERYRGSPEKLLEAIADLHPELDASRVERIVTRSST